ncbi:MAG: TauD/TfdA family dioxygenase [Rhodospirillaceae bacterium]|jgi:taurine dioxygenase|nr:TauD/TfdA family dioxygenase [Rhodospirillaceae bacterium]MBT5811966.1 TauD/TfdA family dioxygenase [Rhodospirillaceae bacterium]
MTDILVTDIPKSMGATVLNFDAANPMSNDTRTLIIHALHDRQFLVFPNQTLTQAQQVAFTQQFGPLEQHINADFQGDDIAQVHVLSNLDDNGVPTKPEAPTGTECWHTDKSYTPTPSFATLLYGIEAPAVGGETLFANMYAAHDALPEADQRRYAEMTVVHSWEQSRLKSGSRPPSEQEKHAAPPTPHPMVRTHPATGRKALYIGTHASHIDDMLIEEGRALLDELLTYATQDQFVVAHKWRKDDLVIWDNPSLLHRGATYDETKEKRVLHRTVVRGGPTF